MENNNDFEENERSPIKRVIIFDVKVEFSINGVIMFTEDPSTIKIKGKLAEYREYISNDTLKAIFNKLDNFMYSIKFEEDPMVLEVLEDGTTSMMYCTKVVAKKR